MKTTPKLKNGKTDREAILRQYGYTDLDEAERAADKVVAKGRAEWVAKKKWLKFARVYELRAAQASCGVQGLQGPRGGERVSRQTATDNDNNDDDKEDGTATTEEGDESSSDEWEHHSEEEEEEDEDEDREGNGSVNEDEESADEGVDGDSNNGHEEAEGKVARQA